MKITPEDAYLNLVWELEVVSKPSYTYDDRDGVLPISWNTFHAICKGLVSAVDVFHPELILAIGRGGYYPGTLLAHMLQVEIYPARVSRRVEDVVRYKQPHWLVQPPASEVAGRRVLVVDEICDSGETLKMVKDKAEGLGAKSVRTAVLYAHSRGASLPDYIGILSDALILNPWDREVYHDGQFKFHPEYVQAMKNQNLEPKDSMLVRTQEKTIAKGAS